MTRILEEKVKKKMNLQDSGGTVGSGKQKRATHVHVDSLVNIRTPDTSNVAPLKRGRKVRPQHRLERRNNKREEERRIVENSAIKDLDDFSFPTEFQRTFPAPNKISSSLAHDVETLESGSESDIMSSDSRDDEEYIPNHRNYINSRSNAPLLTGTDVDGSASDPLQSSIMGTSVIFDNPISSVVDGFLQTDSEKLEAQPLLRGRGILCDLPKAAGAIPIAMLSARPLKEVGTEKSQLKAKSRKMATDNCEVTEIELSVSKFVSSDNISKSAIQTESIEEAVQEYSLLNSPDAVRARGGADSECFPNELLPHADTTLSIIELLDLLRAANDKFLFLSVQCPTFAERCKSAWRRFKSDSRQAIATIIKKLSKDFEYFRLQIEREVNDAFNTAYKSLKRLFWLKMSKDQKKLRKSFGHVHERQLADYAHVEPKLKDHIKKLEQHFWQRYGMSVEVASDPALVTAEVIVNNPTSALWHLSPEDTSAVQEEAEWEDGNSSAHVKQTAKRERFDRKHCMDGLLNNPMQMSKRQRNSRIIRTADDNITNFLVDDHGENCDSAADYIRFDKETGSESDYEEMLAQNFEDKYKKLKVYHFREGQEYRSNEIDMPGENTKNSAPFADSQASDIELKSSFDEVINDFLMLICTMRRSDKTANPSSNWLSILRDLENPLVPDIAQEAWSQKIYKMFSVHQLTALQESDARVSTGGICQSEDERTAMAWQSLTRRLFERLLNDLTDENCLNSKDYSFNEPCVSKENAVFSNTFRILSLIKSLYGAIVVIDEQAIAGIGNILGLIDFFFGATVNYESQAVDRISELLNDNFRRGNHIVQGLAKVSTWKFLKYLHMKFSMLTTAANKPAMAFAYDILIKTLIDRMWRLLTYFNTFYSDLFIEDLTQLIKTTHGNHNSLVSGTGFVYLWWRLAQYEARGNSKYSTKPEMAWSKVTEFALSWLRCSFPSLPREDINVTDLANSFLKYSPEVRTWNCSWPKHMFVDAQKSIWIVIAIHTAAVLMTTDVPRVAANWGTVKFLFANPVPEGAERFLDSASLALRYQTRIAMLSRVWDNFGECFSFWVELCVDNCAQMSPLPRADVDTAISRLSMQDIMCLMKRNDYLVGGHVDLDHVTGSIVEYCVGTCSQYFAESPEYLSTQELSKSFNELLAFATEGLSQVAIKRVTNKLCNDGGILSIYSINDNASPNHIKFLVIFFLSSAIQRLDPGNVLLDGEMEARIRDDFLSSLSEQSTMCDICLSCILMVRVALPWIVEYNEKATVLQAMTSENDVRLATMFVDWCIVYFQKLLIVLSGSTYVLNLFPAVLSVICPLAKLLSCNRFFVSETSNKFSADNTPGIKLFHLLVGLVNIVLSREYGNALDEMFSFAMNVCLRTLGVLAEANSNMDARSKLLIVKDISNRLIAPLRGVFKLLTNSISDTNFKLSTRNCDSLSTCRDASEALSSMAYLTLITDCQPTMPVNKLKVLNSSYGAMIKYSDEYFSRLPGCEDSTLNHWLKVVFWRPFLRFELKKQNLYEIPLNFLITEHLYSITSTWLSCLMTIHATPEVYSDIMFNDFHCCFRDIVANLKLWQESGKNNENQRDSMTQCRLALLDALTQTFSTLDMYVQSNSAVPVFFSPNAFKNKAGLDGALCVSIFFSCISNRTFRLSKSGSLEVLSVFKSCNVDFVDVTRRCIRYIYACSTDASTTRYSEFIKLVNILSATAVGELTFGIIPESLDNIFDEAVLRGSKSLQDYIGKMVVKSGKVIPGYTDRVPLSSEQVISYLPLYVSGVCLTPFSTRFLRWKYLLQLIAGTVDGDASLTDKVFKAWARSVSIDTKSVHRFFRGKLTTDLNIRCEHRSDIISDELYAYWDQKKFDFRIYIIRDGGKWNEFCLSLTAIGSSSKPNETLAFIRSRLCLYIVIETALRPQKKGAWDSDSMPALLCWKSDIPTLIVVTMSATVQLLRIVIGHSISDIIRLHYSVESSKEVALSSTSILSFLCIFDVLRRSVGTDALSSASRFLASNLASWMRDTLSLLLLIIQGKSQSDAQLKDTLMEVKALGVTVLQSLLDSKVDRNCQFPDDLVSDLERSLSKISGQEVDSFAAIKNKFTLIDETISTAFNNFNRGLEDSNLYSNKGLGRHVVGVGGKIQDVIEIFRNFET